MDEEKLRLYLKKCELQYRADHIEHVDCLDWLAPHCEDVKQISLFLRSLGFRIKEVVDEEPCPGEAHRWVETTSGVLVYAGTDGMFGKRRSA